MTPKELITDEMIEKAALKFSGKNMNRQMDFTEGAEWARDFLSTHNREVAEKAFEAGATYQHEFNYVTNYNPFGKIEAPDKETYLNSLNPEGK